MENEKEPHSLNKFFQKLSLVFIFITYTITFWATLYNGVNLMLGVNFDFFYPTLKSGSLAIFSAISFIICLYTSDLFDKVIDEEDFTV